MASWYLAIQKSCLGPGRRPEIPDALPEFAAASSCRWSSSRDASISKWNRSVAGLYDRNSRFECFDQSLIERWWEQDAGQFELQAAVDGRRRVALGGVEFLASGLGVRSARSHVHRGKRS